MCGGGGGSQTVTNEFKPPTYTTNDKSPGSWQNYVNTGAILAGTPYQQSGLPTVAPINDYQNTAGQLAYDMALYGTPMGNAANGAFTNAANGNYANPYAQNVMGIASGQAYNPALQGYAQIAAGSNNPYMSDEYTNNLIQRQADTMAQGYANGTASQDAAAAAMAGAFGGSGDAQLREMHNASLAKQIGDMSAQTLAQQQQFKAGQYQQGIQNQLAGLGGYANAYQGDVNNQLNANAQAGGFWGQDINSILAGAQGGLAGNADYRQNLSGLQNAGNNWNTYYQKLLDSYNNQWNTESQYDMNMNEYLGSVLGRASGSYGTTASTQPGQSTLSQLLGLGLTGAGVYSLFK